MRKIYAATSTITKLVSFVVIISFVFLSQSKAQNIASPDYVQAANKMTSTLGGITWINSNLNANKSTYYEGMAVPQRILLTGLGTSTAAPHVAYFDVEATKGKSYAYDFLTSWDYAFGAAESTISGTKLLKDLFTNEFDGLSS